MKRGLFTFALAALTIGLLGSCSKINERIDGLDKRVYDLENNKIASVEQQITAINTSINELKAADVTINGKIADLKTAADAQQALIDALQEADRALGQKDTELEARIATLEGQVATINGQIATLEDADKAINLRIDQLQSYVDTEIGKTKDWAEETFATLEQYQQTADNLATLSVTVTGISTTLTGIQTSITGLDTKIDVLDADLQGKITAAKTELEGKITSLKTELEDKIASAISASETSIKTWINELLEGYYTAAVVDEKIDALNTAIEAAKDTAKTRIDSVATELTELKTAVDTAKAAIRTEYKNAIDVAINKLDGEIRGALLDSIAAVNGRIEALDTRVTTLEGKVLTLEGNVDKLLAMIQSVSITPAYSDGSVEAVNGILTLKCIVSPAEAIIGMESLKDSLLIYADSVKVKTKATTPAYMTIKVSKASVLDAAQGAITLTADISEYLPKGEDKALTIAVNIRNGISDFTTEFVPVTVAAANPIVAYVEIAAKYDGSTVSTLRWYRQSLAITESGKKAWKDDSGSPVKVPGTDEDVVVGDFFQWGTFAGFYGSGVDSDKGLLPYTSFTSTGCGDGSNAFTFKDGKQFNRTNTPYWSGSAYTKYNATDKKTELDASDDVASIILGGTWRMPTKDEIKAMKEATYWAWDATDKGYYVYAPNPATDAGKVNNGTGIYNKADALLFFPATGYGDGTSMSNAGTYGYYRSSTLYSENTECAYRQFFNGTNVYTDNYTYRYCGYSVRPVQDPKATYKAVTSVSLNETSKNITVGGNLQLKATVIPDDATQQGVYWTSSAPTVATVDATGKVTAVAAGTATITATTVDGNKTATCAVIVTRSVTFKAVYNTNGGANTLTFYYDANDHSGEGITVYEDGTANYLFDNSKSNGVKWGYNGKRGEIKSVVIDASVAGYKGLTSTTFMFQGMATATNISGAEYLDVSNVTDMSFMFNNFGGGKFGSPTTLNVVPDVSKWNTGNVTNMTGMFESYGNFSSSLDKVPDVSNWNTGNVTDMTYMFQKYGHESQNFNAVPDVSKWNTGNVTNMQQMFMEYGHKSTALNTVPNVSGWNTGKVTNMKQMFYNYGSTSENISCVLDLSGWDLSKITGTNGVNVFNFNPKTFDVTIPATTGAKSNESGKWYYGNGTNSIAPPAGKTFTLVEYVEIGGVKWATMNLGAEKVTDYGDYFAWGETAPYYEGTGGWPATPTWKSGKASGYAWQSYCGSSSFSEWSTPPYDATTKILKPEFDAAAQILGNGWRMPTFAEFQALYDACLNGSYDTTTNPSGASASVGKGVYWCTNYDGVAGCLFCDGTNKLFFPAAGYGSNTALQSENRAGCYCSSDLNKTNNQHVDAVNFNKSRFNIANYSRSYGFSIRPVTEE